MRRHFPTRRAFLEAVSHRWIDTLRARAQELSDETDGRGALLARLGDVVTYCASVRGLAAALGYGVAGPEPVHQNTCSAVMEEAGDLLLARAVRDGAVPPGITMADLITLIVGIILATEHHPDPAAAAHRLFRQAVEGLSPNGGKAPAG